METTQKECYITINQEKITVTKEIHAVWEHTKDKVFYQARKEGTCGKNNYATCSGDCGLCRWSKEGQKISLDDEKYHFHCEENGPKRDYSPVEKVPTPADIAEEKDMVERILEQAKQVCPSGDIILSMYAEGYSTYEISEETGIPQKTVYRKIQKLKSCLAQFIRDSDQ